ncbi:hypothetical protein Ancab_002547 [Ancistrocladus abbreviatus]
MASGPSKPFALFLKRRLLGLFFCGFAVGVRAVFVLWVDDQVLKSVAGSSFYWQLEAKEEEIFFKPSTGFGLDFCSLLSLQISTLIVKGEEDLALVMEERGKGVVVRKEGGDSSDNSDIILG